MSNESFLFLIKRTFVLFSCILCLQTLHAQNNKTVTGTVTDDTNEPLPGVTVVLKNTTGGVITDINGKFSINVAMGNTLAFSYVGMQTSEIVIDSRNVYNIQLQVLANELDDVTVVAFAKQKKESVISAISTVNPKDLKVPSSNLTTALAGRIAGLIAYQQSGEPGNDNAQFFIRGVTTFGYKKDPLILIDNIELTTNDLARLNVDDIAQFSIMKDATATALYGARGANGVIIVTTKEGHTGKPKISVRAESSISQPRKMIDVADPITFMNLNNEAVNTRRDLIKPNGALLYSQEKIENTIAGTNPYVYPAVDWYDELFKSYALTHRANMSLSGGGSMVRYYVAASYTKDGGVLKNEKLNNYNNNINLQKYTVRSNVNMDLSKSTEFIIRVNGNFDDYVGPLNGGDQLFNKVMRTSPVLYPKSYPAIGDQANATHVLFGNAENSKYLNPYADMVKGYKEYNRTLIVAQAELKQKFDFLLKGLEARIMVSTTRSSYNETLRYNKPFHYQANDYDKQTDTYQLKLLNTDGEEHLGYYKGYENAETTNYMEAAMSYNRIFDKHSVSGMLVFTRQERKTSNAESLQLSLPRRNQGVAGRFTYAYDSRYFAELNFGYNGSERFSKHERYGFFPSVGAGYIISNEDFWEPLTNTIDKLKFKLTYGLVGNDAIGDPKDRFYYLSEVNMSDGGRGQHFGTEFINYKDGVSNSRYPNPNITWEKSKKTNFGIELGMFNSALEIQADLFYEYRTNIYQGRSYIPASMGLSAGVYANIGEASSRGIDLSASYSIINKDYWIKGMGNFTYAKGKYEAFEEPDYAGFGQPWRSRIGQPIAYNMGYIAERLFIDENDVLNSPSQTGFKGGAMAGDIKYKDINKDGKITEEDQVFLGYPNQPEITYGFGVSAGYKGFDLSVFFQGNARVSFFLEPNKIAPFIDLTGQEKNDLGIDSNLTTVNNLLAVIADDHWSEDNRNSYAFWPRLSPTLIENNNQRSTWWMHDASFLRLKTIELGYTLPKKLTKRLKLETVRLYVTGNNLMTFSKFKLWDPEMGSNGLGYPIQKVYNAGININF
ncbi:TonB-dependent receptor [Bacteroides sp. 224]|uniref:SusC/RagA family TonB-linked outer membrane protein n=1 Tax=Bacteroides sp. 224 TaxID=2302936 RepID=UPI0013D1584A|nr:TonB-dependent receptor [Bacteroides sp. 224]NDV65279.1 TonB-dependent receptor [Bacteroides sp. 224]